jgi:hypothetical protein
VSNGGDMVLFEVAKLDMCPSRQDYRDQKKLHRDEIKTNELHYASEIRNLCKICTRGTHLSILKRVLHCDCSNASFVLRH